VIWSLIVAAAGNDVIGQDGGLPWHLPEDLRRFRRLTTGHPVLAGRVTHESIVTRLGRPLPGRTSFVLSSRAPGQPHPDVVWATSVDAALTAAQEVTDDEAFVIGGASVYQQVLPHVSRIYLTRLHRDVAGDTSLPPGWLDGFTLTARQDQPEGGYSFLDYQRDPT
jgi:dihydrofolate reductase